MSQVCYPQKMYLPACGVINRTDSNSAYDDDSDSSDQDEITHRELPKYARVYVAGTINNEDVNYTVDTGATSTLVSTRIYHQIYPKLSVQSSSLPGIGHPKVPMGSQFGVKEG